MKPIGTGARRPWVSALCAALAAACTSNATQSDDTAEPALDAGAADGSPGAPTSNCFAVPLPVAAGTCMVIDDFATAKAGPINALNVVTLPLSDGRNGKFTHQDTDGTPGGVVDDYSIVAVSGLELPPGITQGVHFAERGFTTWGADYSLSFTGGCYDISATGYDGIAFYAKATTSLALLAGIHTNKTTAAFDCGGADVCWGFFRAQIMLTPTWTKYSLKFADMTQPAWALPQVPFDPKKVVAIIWATAAGGDADWTITDLTFTGHDDTSGCAAQ